MAMQPPQTAALWQVLNTTDHERSMVQALQRGGAHRSEVPLVLMLAFIGLATIAS